MAMKRYCPDCGKLLGTDDTWALARCPGCDRSFGYEGLPSLAVVQRYVSSTDERKRQAIETLEEL